MGKDAYVNFNEEYEDDLLKWLKLSPAFIFKDARLLDNEVFRRISTTER